jgi:hypothetical protein
VPTESWSLFGWSASSPGPTFAATSDLAAQKRKLVAKHHDLELLERRGARAQQDERHQPAQGEIQKRGAVQGPWVEGTEVRELYGDREADHAFPQARPGLRTPHARADEVRELMLAEDFQDVPRDVIWSVAMFLWAEVCARLEDADCADVLYEFLAPLAGRQAVSGPSICGSIDAALGALAVALGRHDQAEAHFTTAAEIEERFGAPLFLARTRAGWARAFII